MTQGLRLHAFVKTMDYSGGREEGRGAGAGGGSAICFCVCAHTSPSLFYEIPDSRFQHWRCGWGRGVLFGLTGHDRYGLQSGLRRMHYARAVADIVRDGHGVEMVDPADRGSEQNRFQR